MANESLKLKEVAPLANAIRAGEGPMQRIRIAEALDLLQRNLVQIGARLPKEQQMATSQATAPTSIDYVVVNLGSSPTSISDVSVVQDGKLLVVRVNQDSTGTRDFSFDSVYFHPVTIALNPDPNSYSVYLFVGVNGKWMSIATPVTGQTE